MARLFMGVKHRYGFGELQFDRDYYSDDEKIAIGLPISPRGKTLGFLFTLMEDAAALIAAVAGGGLTLQRTVDLLQAGHAAALIKQPESVWLDGKRAPYRLNEESQKWELAKDVAAFANAASGGVIVIGARTSSTRDGDVVEAITEIDLSMIRTQSYRPIIMNRVHPTIEGLVVRTVDLGGGRGIAYVHVPPQPEERKPFAVRGAMVAGRVQSSFICIPTRDGEDTRYADLTEVYGLIQAGRARLTGG
jgi:hypothetical protein